MEPVNGLISVRANFRMQLYSDLDVLWVKLVQIFELKAGCLNLGHV